MASSDAVARALLLERFATYPLEQLGSGDDALDGPFVMASGGFGLLVSLRGKEGGAMPSPSRLHWRRDLPPALASAPCHVFLRRDASALYLGSAHVRRKGSLPRDSFKVELVLDDPPDEPTWRAWVAEATAPPPPAPEEALAAIERDSTTEQRMAAITVLVERWFARPRAAASTSPSAGSAGEPAPARTPADRPARGVIATARALITAVPEPLHRLHALTAGRPVCVQNRLVPAAQLTAEVGEPVAFYVENQGVYTWAYEASGAADPRVVVRGSEHTRTWQLEAEHLSSFLAQLLVLECTFGAPFSAHHDTLDARGFSRLGKLVRPLALPAWRTTQARFFGSDGVIGFAMPDGSDWSVWLGASDRRHVERLTSFVEDWPHVGW